MENVEEESNKYILFSILGEQYACNLIQVKEVIKPLNIKPVPFMVPYFKGMINLRGKIISVIDFRLKFNPKFENKENAGVILVVENENFNIGVIVDDLISVQTINKEEIQKNHEMKYSIDMKFILGNYISKNNLVTILDLGSCINEEELKAIKENEKIQNNFINKGIIND
jgi:purine-binding chemotaxis protein CheW